MHLNDFKYTKWLKSSVSPTDGLVGWLFEFYGISTLFNAKSIL